MAPQSIARLQQGKTGRISIDEKAEKAKKLSVKRQSIFIAFKSDIHDRNNRAVKANSVIQLGLTGKENKWLFC